MQIICTQLYGFEYSYLMQIICTQLYGFKYSYLMQIFCKQLYGFKYSYLMQIICTQLYSFKYSYQMQIICTQLYGFKYSYLLQIFCTQLYGFKCSHQIINIFIFNVPLHPYFLNHRPSHTKDSKIVNDAALLNTQHNKVRIKSKVEQSREWSSTLPYTFV